LKTKDGARSAKTTTIPGGKILSECLLRADVFEGKLLETALPETALPDRITVR
jgi:hypothetical protein